MVRLMFANFRPFRMEQRTYHSPRKESCQEKDGCACARVCGERRFATTHLEMLNVFDLVCSRPVCFLYQ